MNVCSYSNVNPLDVKGLNERFRLLFKEVCYLKANGGGGVTLPYKSYVGFLTQSGTSAPTITILEDTITGITIARTGVGTYTFTKSGAWILNKTVPLNDLFSDVDGNIFKLVRTSENVMTLTTYSYTDTGIPSDGVLNNRFITIQVYN